MGLNNKLTLAVYSLTAQIRQAGLFLLYPALYGGIAQRDVKLRSCVGGVAQPLPTRKGK